MANNSITTMEELIKDSIRVTLDMVAVFPQLGKEEAINVSEIVPKFPGRYATNNSTVAFVHSGSFYVTPYTRRAMSTLKANGFREADFYVPFSNWDYPKTEQSKWNSLKEKARKSHEEDFADNCAKFCDEHHIGAIGEETLQNCFMMPNDGVRVKHPHFEDCYYPIISNYCLDGNAVDALGTYCTNNGRVVFVYRDGHTYVTKGYKIISELRAAGYKEKSVFVPFSNGEVIQDYALKARWDSISK